MTRGGSGTSQMGGGNGESHNSSWGPGAQYAAELRILLVYLSESLGRLGQNGGTLGGPHFIGGCVEPPWAGPLTGLGEGPMEGGKGNKERRKGLDGDGSARRRGERKQVKG